MSDNNEIPTQPHPVYDAPGCGLASYSCILLLFFLIGVFGIISSLASIFFAEFQTKPFFLVPGNQVPVWRLQPMRDAKLLELTEVPLYYHDETQNGTKGCALSTKGLLRLDGNEHWMIPYSEIESSKVLYENKQVVTVIKTKSGELLPCFFGPTEGGERFRRYLLEQQP
jgi:hypothetical protein